MNLAIDAIRHLSAPLTLPATTEQLGVSLRIVALITEKHDQGSFSCLKAILRFRDRFASPITT